jgi:uncharacterized DUF497 family protein
MKFEWDETKNTANKAKHRISFETAVRVFTDPNRLERYDSAHDEEEDRWMTIGMVPPAVLAVIYTERQAGDVCRIISARKADEHERKEYYDV